MRSYRQGDVLLRQVSDAWRLGHRFLIKMPKNAKKRAVLARGEFTGHAHTISDRSVDFFVRNGYDPKQRYLGLHEGAVLKHEEHRPIAMEAGEYQVHQQQQYDPAADSNVQPVHD